MTMRIHPMLIPAATAALLLLAAPACDRAKAKAPEAHGPGDGHDHEKKAEAGHEGHDHDEGVSLEGIRGIRVMTVAGEHAESAWFPGEAVGDERAQAMVSSPVAGVVTKLLVPPGRKVGRGTAVAVVQSPELARLKADWLTARARRERVEADLAREQRLFDARAGSRRELEAAQSEAKVARAEEEAARLALEARGLTPESAGATFTVKAPDAGTVVTWKVVAGQGVAPGVELASFQAALASAVKVELAPGVGETWKPGHRVKVRASDGRTWMAEVEGAPLALSAEARRQSWRLKLAGGSAPLPGTAVEVEVGLARAICVPQVAVQQVEGVWGVFVQEGERAAFRPVKKGAEHGLEVVILEGLKAGDRVVAEGAYLLKSAQMKAKGGEEGHVH